MSTIDDVATKLGSYFSHTSGPSYVRLMDTPGTWGLPFGPEVMPKAWARQEQYARSMVEIMQKARYRCDLASLNCPDPSWGRVVLGAMDTALTALGSKQPTQFRFLFGQTPMYPFTEPPNYTDFKGAVIRFIRLREAFWERTPEIWFGRFYRLQEGILSSLKSKIPDSLIGSDDDTKMTWNHAKIVVADGAEALVGGHNLNMDLFRSYPPVHDASVVVHGDAACGAQLFLDRMWACKTDLLTKEFVDINKRVWRNGDDDLAAVRRPIDPLTDPAAADYVRQRQRSLVALHQSGRQPGTEPPPPVPASPPPAHDIRERDLRTFDELKQAVFVERVKYDRYDGFAEYKLATRMLSVGKYWTGSNMQTDYQKGSEVMKEHLIKSARRSLRMSQMDLISAWKKNWTDHVVCIWLIEALLANGLLDVEIVVSPLDAGAGAEGDQYSFGSGARRTFDLIAYYMTHDVATDAPLPDPGGARAAALRRLHIAPFFYTDQVPKDDTTEGVNYQWPDLPPEGYTATLKQPPLSQEPPRQGVIGSAAMSVLRASGYVYKKVPSAPGNHAKIMIVDDEVYVVGSDNLYPGFLSEFNYLVEGTPAVQELIRSYWAPLWKYSGPHAISGAGIP